MIRRIRLLRHLVALTLRADRWCAAVAVLLLLGQSGVVAMTGLGQRMLVNDAAGGAVVGVVAAVVLGACASALGGAGARVLDNMLLYLTTRVTIAATDEIQRFGAGVPTVDHLVQTEHLDRLERLRRDGGTLAWLAWRVLGAATAALSIVVSVVLLGTVHPLLSALAVLSVPALLAGRRANAILGDARDRCTELERDEQQLHDLCLRPEPAKELFVNGAGALLSGRADDLWNEAVRRQRHARIVAAGWRAAGWLVVAGGVVVALLLVDRLVWQGRAGVGDAVLVFTLTVQLQGQLRQVLDSLGSLPGTANLIEHYWWLRSYADAHRGGGAPVPAALAEGITVDGLRFRYAGAAAETLRGVSLRLRPGSTVALVGANGAGKSTLVKLLAGVHEPTGGEIRVDGRPLREYDRRSWQSRVSGVLQDFARLQLRVRTGVGVGDLTRLHDDAEVARAVTAADADGFVAAFPQRLRTQLGRAFGGVDPSPGQWQRLALARGLMRRAPLLLVLDEPTAALDPQTEFELFHRFVTQIGAARSRGTVTLLISHRLTTVRLADLVVVLDEGRVAQAGTHVELMAAGGTYAQMFRLQERAFGGPVEIEEGDHVG